MFVESLVLWALTVAVVVVLVVCLIVSFGIVDDCWGCCFVVGVVVVEGCVEWKLYCWNWSSLGSGMKTFGLM